MKRLILRGVFTRGCIHSTECGQPAVCQDHLWPWRHNREETARSCPPGERPQISQFPVAASSMQVIRRFRSVGVGPRGACTAAVKEEVHASFSLNTGVTQAEPGQAGRDTGRTRQSRGAAGGRRGPSREQLHGHPPPAPLGLRSLECTPVSHSHTGPEEVGTSVRTPYLSQGSSLRRNVLLEGLLQRGMSPGMRDPYQSVPIGG